MVESAISPLRDQLLNRRSNLEHALATSPGEPQLERLLAEVDAAIDRTSKGTYGLCELCKEPIEADRLIADPLVRFCLEHMTPSQQRALEQDLELAAQIQSALLPQRHLLHGGWEAAYHYEGAGPISGDYCDLLCSGEEATGLPLGMFCEEHFSVSKVKLTPGDTIIAYTDGLSEAVDASGAQYGTD
jgi:hypothetical protein